MTNPNLRISLRSATPRISRCTDLYDEAGKDSISVDTVKRARRALKDELTSSSRIAGTRDWGIRGWGRTRKQRTQAQTLRPWWRHCEQNRRATSVLARLHGCHELFYI